MGKTTWQKQSSIYYADRFAQYIEEKANDYTLLEPYINANTNILMRHNVCGHEWKVRPNNFIHGGRCPECNRKKPAYNRHTAKTFEQSLDKICGEHLFEVIEYLTWNEPVTFKCCQCGHIFQKSANQFRVKPHCPKCNPRTSWNRLTTQDYKQRVHKLYGTQFEILSDYDTKDSIMHIKCNACDYDWYQRADTILMATKCDRCYPNMSYGVKRIFDFLVRHNINFRREVSMPGMKLKAPLHFDFCLYDTENQLLCAIEYDGEQHYKAPNWWGGEEKLIITQQRDLAKNQYCTNNNIRLYRILWKDYDNIPSILSDILVLEHIWTKHYANYVKAKEGELNAKR